MPRRNIEQKAEDAGTGILEGLSSIATPNIINRIVPEKSGPNPAKALRLAFYDTVWKLTGRGVYNWYWEEPLFYKTRGQLSN